MDLTQAGKTDTEDSATADGATTGVEGDSDTPSLGVPAVPSTDFLLSAETEANAVAKRRCGARLHLAHVSLTTGGGPDQQLGCMERKACGTGITAALHGWEMHWSSAAALSILPLEMLLFSHGPSPLLLHLPEAL